MGDEHTISGNYFHEIVIHASDAGVTCESVCGAGWNPAPLACLVIALMPCVVL